MPLPTLYSKGKLLATKWSESQEELNKHIPLDYIINWISERVGANSTPKSPADRVLILKSSTGSGKSTVLPPEIFHTLFESKLGRRTVLCTQPRVLNTITIPEDIVKYNTKPKSGREPLVMGENIGFQTGTFQRSVPRGLLYMQINILGNQLISMSDEEIIAKYGCIILDEVHEQTIGMAFAMYALKQFLGRNATNPLCPMIITTSATFDVIKYADYFLDAVKAPARYKNIIEVEGFSYPVVEHFLDYDSADYIASTVDTIVSIHKNNKHEFGVGLTIKGASGMLPEDVETARQKILTFRDILVFVHGAADIRALSKRINTLNSTDPFFIKYPVLPIELTRETIMAKSEKFNNIFAKIEDTKVEVETGKGKSDGGLTWKTPMRRVIIATNVGETGITYDYVKHVIETGWFNTNEFDPCFEISCLALKPVTKGIYKQRRGRSNRINEGESYAMYTKTTYDAMPEDQLSELIKSDISQVLLKFIIKEFDTDEITKQFSPLDLYGPYRDAQEFRKRELDMQRKEFANAIDAKTIDLTNLDLIDKPSADSIAYCLNKLYMLGAITPNIRPTPIGFLMGRFQQTPIESIKTILSGYAWDAPIIDLVTMTALLQVRKSELFPRALEDNFYAAASKNVFAGSDIGPKAPRGYATMRHHLTVADDFIFYLYVFYEFQKKMSEYVSGGESVDDLQTIEEWCTFNGLGYNAMITAIEMREDLIETLATIGFNPYDNFHKSITHILDSPINHDREDILSHTKLVKQCIYEGYKLNVAMWNKHMSAYITRSTHLRLRINNPLTDINPKPQFIMYDALSMRFDRIKNTYVISVENISVIDGFIPFDATF